MRLVRVSAPADPLVVLERWRSSSCRPRSGAVRGMGPQEALPSGHAVTGRRVPSDAQSAPRGSALTPVGLSWPWPAFGVSADRPMSPPRHAGSRPQPDRPRPACRRTIRPTPAVATTAPRTDESIAVIGLGYTGLPLAIALVEAGMRVEGIDSLPSRVAELRRASPIDDIDDPRLQSSLLGIDDLRPVGSRPRPCRRHLRLRADAHHGRQGPRSDSGPQRGHVYQPASPPSSSSCSSRPRTRAPPLGRSARSSRGPA